MKISENIKKIRKENNLSQEDLAELLSVSRQSVSKWESGLSYPEMDKILLICKKFNYNIDELMNENIKEVNNRGNSIMNFTKEFIRFIENLVNLFIKMTFYQKIKFLVEQFFILIGLYIVFNFVTLVFDYLYFEIFSYDMGVMVFLGNLLEGFLKIVMLFLSMYIYYYILDSRYIKYVIVDSNDSKKEKFIKKEESKIIIRDPKDSKMSIFDVIAMVIVWVIKFSLLFVLLLMILFLISLIVGLTLSFTIINNFVLFIGIVLTIVSLAIIVSMCIISLYKFLFNIKVNKMLFLIINFIAIIFTGFGIGLFSLGIINLDEVNDNELYTEEYFIKDFNINDVDEILTYGLNKISYVINDSDEVNLTVYHSKYNVVFSYDYINYESVNIFVIDGNVYFELDKFISTVYNDLINNVRPEVNISYNLVISGSEENINLFKSKLN